MRDTWAADHEPPTGGWVAAALGSAIAFATVGASATILLAEGDLHLFVLLVTYDPRGVLELESLLILVGLALGVVAAPFGCGVALRVRHHAGALVSAAWTFPLTVPLVVGAAWAGGIYGGLPWLWLAAVLVAGLGGRWMGLRLSRPGRPRSAG